MAFYFWQSWKVTPVIPGLNFNIWYRSLLTNYGKNWKNSFNNEYFNFIMCQCLQPEYNNESVFCHWNYAEWYRLYTGLFYLAELSSLHFFGGITSMGLGWQFITFPPTHYQTISWIVETLWSLSRWDFKKLNDPSLPNDISRWVDSRSGRNARGIPKNPLYGRLAINPVHYWKWVWAAVFVMLRN